MYRLTGSAPLVIVRTKTGQLRHHYLHPVHNTFGPIIESIDDAQGAYLLRVGMIERMDSPTADSDDGPRDVPAPDQVIHSDRVNAIVAALDNLGVPMEAGAPTARAALRDAGHSAPNDLIAAAVKLRRRSHGAQI